MSNNAVTVENVSKRFRIYKERKRSLKQMILRRNGGIYEEFWAQAASPLFRSNPFH